MITKLLIGLLIVGIAAVISFCLCRIVRHSLPSDHEADFRKGNKDE